MPSLLKTTRDRRDLTLGEISGTVYSTPRNSAPTSADRGVWLQTQTCVEIIEPAGINWQWEWSGKMLVSELEMLRF